MAVEEVRDQNFREQYKTSPILLSRRRATRNAFPIANVGGVVPSGVGLRPVETFAALEEGEEGLTIASGGGERGGCGGFDGEEGEHGGLVTVRTPCHGGRCVGLCVLVVSVMLLNCVYLCEFLISYV
jgi:hypothetical protein